MADAGRFIRVNGYDLEVDDAKSFRYVGCNLPMLLQDAAREAPDAQGTYPTVDALLDDVAALGIKALARPPPPMREHCGCPICHTFPELPRRASRSVVRAQALR